MGQFCYCSLSPQGDDNYTVEAEQTSATIAAYPRKGTITITFGGLMETNMNCSLSPQGGKKLRIKKDAEFFFCKP